MKIKIFVEIDRTRPPQKLEFEKAEVRGAEIKQAAGVPLGDELAIRNGQQLELVTNEQVITIKNGDHFVTLPPGSIS